MLEEERKYEVDPRFAVPDLSGCLPAGGEIVTAPPAPLRATYYDTADRRLARAGASLRFRRGDALPWTVKLPTGVAGIRHEISRAGPPGRPPPARGRPRRASAGDVVIRALRTDIARMLSYAPLVRLREPLPDGDTAVHQMRVGVRRLRTDLRTFRPLLDPLWSNA